MNIKDNSIPVERVLTVEIRENDLKLLGFLVGLTSNMQLENLMMGKDRSREKVGSPRLDKTFLDRVYNTIVEFYK